LSFQKNSFAVKILLYGDAFFMELSDTDLVSSVQEAREEFNRGGGKFLEEVI